MDIHSKALERIKNGDERIGQAYFNASTELDAKWANTMFQTIDNPFFNDNVLHYFLAHWQEDHPEEK